MTDLAGVVGHPVSHSISPEIFSFLARRLRRDLEYRRIDIPPARLRSTVQAIAPLELFTGWNVTIPHKEAILDLVDKPSPAALAIGALNVVQFKNGKLLGHNTDVLGIAETFREQGFDARGASALIHGAGGAALAVGYVLGERRAARVAFHNRTSARARRAAKSLQQLFPKTRFETASVRDVARGEFALVANATPMGMKGFASQAPALPECFTSGTLAFDLVYRPALTPFLKAAQKRGYRAVGGLDMLIWQAIATWEIWFGSIPGRERAKAELKTHIQKVLKL